MREKFTIRTPYKRIHLRSSKRGLYYHNCKPNGEKRDVTFVQTLQENKEAFTKREIKDAEKERSAYNMVGRPSAADFEQMVRGNMLKNCPVSVTDIKNAHTIFGPDVGSLHCKTVRRKSETVMSNYVALTKQTKEKNKTVEVTVDMLFVKKIPFLISLGKYEVYHNQKCSGSESGHLVKSPP